MEIQTRKVEQVIAVPIQAVTTRDTAHVSSSKELKNGATSEPASAASVKKNSAKECVFIYRDGAVQMRTVKTGIQDNQFIQIIEGLKEGEQVVTSPYNAVSRTLKNGDQVKVVSKEELFTKTKE